MRHDETIIDKINDLQYFNDTICFPSNLFPIISNESSYIIDSRILNAFTSINNMTFNEAINSIQESNGLPDSNIFIAFPDIEDESYINEAILKEENGIHEIFDKLPIFTGTKNFYIDYNILMEYHKTTSIGTDLLESFHNYIDDNANGLDHDSVKLIIDESELLQNIYLLKYLPKDMIRIREMSHLDPIYDACLESVFSVIDEARAFKFHKVPDKPEEYSKEWQFKTTYDKNKKNKNSVLGSIIDDDDIEDLRLGRFDLESDTDDATKELMNNLKNMGVFDDDTGDKTSYGIAYNFTSSDGKHGIILAKIKKKKALLGRIIASLRGIYRKFLKKQNDNIRANPEKANKIKKFLVKLANIIDRLAYKLEKLVS